MSTHIVGPRVYEAKTGADRWFPVYLVDATDGCTAETGIAHGSLSVKYSPEGASSLSGYTPGADNWREAGEGKYWLRIGSEEFADEQQYAVSVTATGCRTDEFSVDAHDLLFGELVDDIGDMAYDLDDIIYDVEIGGVVVDSINNDAITAAAVATGAIDALTLTADALAEIADAVWRELISDHEGTPGSFAEVQRWVLQALCGKILCNSTDNTLRIYNTDGASVLVTLTHAEIGDQVSRVPDSVVL